MQIGQIVQFKQQNAFQKVIIEQIYETQSLVVLEDGQRIKISNKDILPHLQTYLFGDLNKQIISLLDTLQERDESCIQVDNLILSINKLQQEEIQVKKQSMSFENYLNQTGIEGYDILPYVYQIYGRYKISKQFIWITGQNNKGKSVKQKQLVEIIAENMEDSIDAQVLKQQIEASDYILDIFSSTESQSKVVSIVNIQIQNNKMIGLKYESLLIDKHRITMKDNFKIISYMLQSLSQDDKDKLSLNEQFPWLNIIAQKIDFNINWFALFQMDDKIDQIYSILAGLLHLRNIEYTNATPPTVQNPESLELAKNLLQIDGNKLTQLLTMKFRKVGAQMIETPMQSAECKQMRDFVVRDIYDKLFMGLVDQMNKQISQPGEAQIQIFQFFHQDSLEQFENLSLNYFNEKIFYYQFCKIQENTQLEFKTQGLENMYQYQVNNQNIIDFLEAPQIGLVNIIDEQSLALSDDVKFFDKLKNTYKTNKIFVQTKTNLSFQITHSWGGVEYQLTSFRSINKDELSQLMIDIMDASKNLLLKGLYPKTLKQTDKTQLQKIKTYLNNLCKQFQAAENTIIQCIDLTDKDSKLQYQTEQLLNIYNSNLPIRMSNQQFEIFKVLNLKDYIIHYGKTEVMMSAETFKDLQNSFNNYCLQKQQSLKKITNMVRSYKFRKGLKIFFKHMNTLRQFIFKYKLKLTLKSIIKIQQWFRRSLYKLHRKKYLSTALIIQTYYKVQQERINYTNITKSIRRIQQFCLIQLAKRKLIQLKKDKWNSYVKTIISLQKRIRGYLCRKHNQKIIGQIMLFRNKYKRNKAVIKIQSHIRRYLVQKQNRIFLRNLIYIQSWMRMFLKVNQYQRIRTGLIYIQYQSRKFLQKLRIYKKEFVKYIQPIEKQRQQFIEHNQLFTHEYMKLISQWLDQLSQSNVMNKVQIVSLILDIEFISDLSEIYQNWQNRFVQICNQLCSNKSMIAEIQVQETDTILITQSGKCYSLNNNKIQQGIQYSFGDQNGIIIDSQRRSSQVSQKDQSWVFEDVSQIEARGKQYFAISKGQLYQIETQLPVFNKVDLISLGNNFCQFISCMQLWSYGHNHRGQLGLGDLCQRNQPCKVSIDVIHQVSCGHSHVIARSFNKIYVWGDNITNQLGIINLKYTSNPQLREFFNLIPISVAAGRTTSFLITQTHRIYVTGRLSTIQYQEFTQFPEKYSFLQNTTLLPLRIQSSWSRTMSVISCNFASDMTIFRNNTMMRDKILNSVAENWRYGLNPNLTEAQEKYFRQQKKETQLLALPIIENSQVIEELKQIKTRMINLLSIPQSKWTHADHLFMRNTKL